MEHPGDLAGDHVVGLHVGGRRIVTSALRGQRDDEEVLENPSGVARLQRVPRFAPQRDAQIHAAVLAERGDRVASLGVDRGQVPGIQIHQPAILAVLALPVVEAARANRALIRVAPQLLARRRIEGDDGVAGALHVHHVVHDDGIERDIPGHRIGPGDLQLRDIGLVDLVERGVLRRVRAALIGRPGGVRLGAAAAVRLDCAASVTMARVTIEQGSGKSAHVKLSLWS